MEIGNKILELRKKNQLSQEALSEKIGVTRQTISKWELNETSPDLKQAKALAAIFHVSLDDLADHDIQSLPVQKMSNTEKLAGLVIKVIKMAGWFLAALLILILIFYFLSLFIFKNSGADEITNKISAFLLPLSSLR